jgi:ABC-type sugar transport system permease subunit
MQLARTALQRDLRTACVAFLRATAWGLRGITRQICLAEMAMPTVVMTTVLATEFDAEPGYVTSMVLMTTLQRGDRDAVAEDSSLMLWEGSQPYQRQDVTSRSVP